MLAGNKKRVLDERLSFRRNDKIPYGLFAAYRLVSTAYAGAETNVSRVSPLEWANKDYVAESNTLMFLVSRQFNPSEQELEYLQQFVKEGNNVFICTPYMSKLAADFFKIEETNNVHGVLSGPDIYRDTGNSSLEYPPYPARQSFYNPGFSYTSGFAGLDSGYYETLGKNKHGEVNFCRIRSGRGSFFFHSNPFLFANYFLLRNENVNYLESALSLIPGSPKKIIWDEYYVYKSADPDRDDPWPLRVLASYPAFRWALMLSLLLLALYVVLNLKRMQRMIPQLAAPKNESLDFIKTMGRLYYEKGDHANLSRKMSAYFLDLVRNKYFIQTSELDEEMVKSLSNKSGYPEEKVNELINKVRNAQEAESMDEEHLTELYSAITDFYKQSI